MKIIVISDSHGSFEEVNKIIRQNSKADVVAFCGDGSSDLDYAKQQFTDKMFLSVRGNCDWCSSDAFLQEITLCGKKIVITHGHLHGVKEGYSRISYLGHDLGANIVLFGHTHLPHLSYDGRILLMNPGSVAFGNQYGLIDIDDDTGKINAELFPKNKYNPPITID